VRSTNYSVPGVYIQDKPTGFGVIQGISPTIGCFIGTSARGKVGVPIKVTSWNDYIEKYAGGLETPFLSNSDLAYAVYGFFQNGGKVCYIIRVAETGVKAFVNSDATATKVVFTALDEGVWGNNLQIKIESGGTEGEDARFNVYVYLKINNVVTLMEKYTNLSNSATSTRYYPLLINGISKFITVSVAGTLVATEANLECASGSDGIAVTDATYSSAIDACDTCKDMRFLAVAGQTTSAIYTKLSTYANARKNIFVFFDLPSSNTSAQAITTRQSITCTYGAVFHSWIKVVDPLSPVGALRNCPPSGHVMGAYARIIGSRGIGKAPAGVEAVLYGAVELVTNFTDAQRGDLNDAHVNALVAKPNLGIVIWGARSLNLLDEKFRYVTDILIDTYIKESVKLDTEWSVFEPNNNRLWTRIQTTVEDFLHGLWEQGALAGESASEAYVVKCDGDINTLDVIASGEVRCQVGYARTKPSEFTVFEFSHKLGS
jgi:phage tail sheath protein FI